MTENPRCFFTLKVWGEQACFTRPEMKVERVSYDVMTPSAARGILEAIFWHPGIRWVITQLDVLKPIKWFSVRRNEVSSKASKKKLAIFIEDDRQQRAGLFLKDVAYTIHAHFELIRQGRDGDIEKYSNIFRRRAEKGQCFHRPYLGCREFAADFSLIPKNEEAPQPINETRYLGWMLNDLDFSNPQNPEPHFFRATMDKGTIKIPPFKEGVA